MNHANKGMVLMCQVLSMLGTTNEIIESRPLDLLDLQKVVRYSVSTDSPKSA